MNEKLMSLKENISLHFKGKEEVVNNLIITLLAGGHALIEDVPGVGKTTLAKALADSIKASFGRIQFTPDTLPGDVVGTSVFDAKTSEFKIVKGPIHNQLFLADEINRTSPRTQSALLEAMEERQVTIDGTTFELPELFMVIATQNPSEQIGTYPLPEAELDRFMVKLKIGYPNKDMQMTLAKSYLEGSLSEKTESVLTADEVIAMKNDVKNVIIKDEVIEYALNIVDSTRKLNELEYGLSPRASLDLLSASKANAYLNGRDYVLPQDIIDMSKVVLTHRLIPTSKARMDKYTGEQLLTQVTEKIERPR